MILDMYDDSARLANLFSASSLANTSMSNSSLQDALVVDSSSSDVGSRASADSPDTAYTIASTGHSDKGATAIPRTEPVASSSAIHPNSRKPNKTPAFRRSSHHALPEEDALALVERRRKQNREAQRRYRQKARMAAAKESDAHGPTHVQRKTSPTKRLSSASASSDDDAQIDANQASAESDPSTTMDASMEETYGASSSAAVHMPAQSPGAATNPFSLSADLSALVSQTLEANDMPHDLAASPAMDWLLNGTVPSSSSSSGWSPQGASPQQLLAAASSSSEASSLESPPSVSSPPAFMSSANSPIDWSSLLQTLASSPKSADADLKSIIEQQSNVSAIQPWPVARAETHFDEYNRLLRDASASLSGNVHPTKRQIPLTAPKTASPYADQIFIPRRDFFRAFLSNAVRLGFTDNHMKECKTRSPINQIWSVKDSRFSELGPDDRPLNDQVELDEDWKRDLPENMRPTAVQLRTPHNLVFDTLPWPAVRNRILMMVGAGDSLATMELKGDMMRLGKHEGWHMCAFYIHGDHPEDMMDEQCWELSEAFATKFWFLLDKHIIRTTNRWRRARGVHPIVVPSMFDSSVNGSPAAFAA
ncbi:hypothetical protein IE81DRAFT_323219 [Ceraceosorus guamensis]|uniref:BZIP domain-containing protein n=1 Tax=Ceraceosorus guamensis TaxID=1522189 RepID=A0A316VYU0_9BASI|nr:hypothetical protein IE81DRAFT_323219 [Ceraceosorus guamensis]PWN42670.1 hypothetical protein IE81DRAFT_323219 [Ceraceosorus guamensis]